MFICKILSAGFVCYLAMSFGVMTNSKSKNWCDLFKRVYYVIGLSKSTVGLNN